MLVPDTAFKALRIGPTQVLCTTHIFTMVEEGIVNVFFFFFKFIHKSRAGMRLSLCFKLFNCKLALVSQIRGVFTWEFFFS